LQEGTTPLILACANNHLDCVKELLKQGGDPNARRLVTKIF
jgi:ankyrin repeat protein